MSEQQPIVWVHGDCLSPRGPALDAHSDAPAIFVWDEALLDAWQIGLKRVTFIYECLLELPVVIRRGDVAAEVLRFAAGHGATAIVTAESPSPRFRDLRDRMAATLPVATLPVEPFIRPERRLDLKRFSRYWKVAEQTAFEPSGQLRLFE